MKVSSSTKPKGYRPQKGWAKARIEFAIPDAGNSSSGEKRNRKEKSVRLAWWSPSGRFDPVSSAELPEWGVLDVVEACAHKDFFSPAKAAGLIKALAGSIERQAAKTGRRTHRKSKS